MGRGVLAGMAVAATVTLAACGGSSQVPVSITSVSVPGGTSAGGAGPAAHTAPSPRVPHVSSSQSVNQIIVLEVHPAITTITVSSDPVVGVVGSPVTLVATLAPIYPSGTVSFTDGGIPIPNCQNLPVSQVAPYVVDCTVTYAAAGTHVIVAAYTGSYSTLPATSAPYDLVITASNTPRGYWLVASDGGVFAFGDAGFHGSTGGVHLVAPVVGMAASADGNGYWLVGSDGGVFAFGDAAYHGSTGGVHLVAPVVGIDPSGSGYRLVASDGGIFAFGGAGFYGSQAGSALTDPVVSVIG